ncbi:MAG: leucine-rich repeat domain-containing protein, partial [Alphaproteobacteria bacterium]|nr:leucine-rich repeat domain-containing protein [Alphaproteobacteria bacterium]
ENALAVVSGNCGSRSGSGTTQDPYVYADNCQWTLDTDTGEMTISGTGNMYYAEYDYNQNKWPRPWASYISSIKTVTVEDGITSVANGAFSGATHLESVDMSNSLTRIGNSAFWSTALTSVSIPSSVTSVEANAFRNATGLKDITFEGNMPNCGIGWIQDDPSDLIISFSGGEADKNKLLHAIQIGGAYQEVCQNGHSNCTYTPSAQENVTLRLMEPDGTMIYYNDKGNIIKMGGKRIYTIEEATKAAGEVNKVSIRYR